MIFLLKKPVSKGSKYLNLLLKIVVNIKVLPLKYAKISIKYAKNSIFPDFVCYALKT